MRQRKVKELDRKLEAVSDFAVEEPSSKVWTKAFPAQRLAGPRPLYLEIGCGKGDFLLQQALAHPDCDFIGIEGQASVVLRAMEKAARIASGQAAEDDPDWMAAAAESAHALLNIRFACAFVNHMEDLFANGTLAGVYLNFSDPWPKGRHAKRRLTWRGRLQEYARALQPGGFIAFKTDNDDLFQFTLEEIAACGWTPEEETWDLHGPDCTYEARIIQTEYEQKFRRAGRQIHYVKVVIRHP